MGINEEFDLEILKKTTELENHHHNREIWIGNAGVEDSLFGYHLVSGNGDFGTAIPLLTPGDTPYISGNTRFDPHRIIPIEVSSSSVYYVRLIWDPVSVAAGEAARTYTTLPIFPTGVGANLDGMPIDVLAERLHCGVDRLWVKIKNATNLATMDIILGIHEYER